MKCSLPNVSVRIDANRPLHALGEISATQFIANILSKDRKQPTIFSFARWEIGAQDHSGQKLISPNKTLRRALRPVRSICMLERIFKRSVAAQTRVVVIDKDLYSFCESNQGVGRG